MPAGRAAFRRRQLSIGRRPEDPLRPGGFGPGSSGWRCGGPRVRSTDIRTWPLTGDTGFARAMPRRSRPAAGMESRDRRGRRSEWDGRGLGHAESRRQFETSSMDTDRGGRLGLGCRDHRPGVVVRGLARDDRSLFAGRGRLRSGRLGGRRGGGTLAAPKLDPTDPSAPGGVMARSSARLGSDDKAIALYQPDRSGTDGGGGLHPVRPVLDAGSSPMWPAGLGKSV